MNFQKSKGHHVWRPRVSSDHEFNPFVRESGSEQSFDHGTVDEMEEWTSESESREDEAQPAKTRQD